jgi:transposase
MGSHLASASPAEVTLIETALTEVAVPRRRGAPRCKPDRLIYDKAADSDPLRARLRRRGIELITPHRKSRRRPATQDGRKLRRYRRRWKVERSIAWLGNYRRLLVRHEHDLLMFRAFVNVACMLIALRQL